MSGQDGSFMDLDPDKAAKYQAALDDANNVLREQQRKIQDGIDRLASEGVGFQPGPASRYEALIDFLFPADADENDNFGNLERIQYEQHYNAQTLRAIHEAERNLHVMKAEYEKQQRLGTLQAGVPGQIPIDPRFNSGRAQPAGTPPALTVIDRKKK